MKKKALVLAVCMAVTAPTISVAKALPSELVGLSLGEIQSSSYLHEPFKAVIPILFTDVKHSGQLKVRLAPESVFQQVGAEKLPVLNTFRFQVNVRNNQPVILVSSRQAIQTPFINFVLEVESPTGRIYQDYTALLDPADLQASEIRLPNPEIEASHAILLSPQIEALLSNSTPKPAIHHPQGKQHQEKQGPELDLVKLQSELLLSAYNSPRLKSGAPTKYVVKPGDSLSQIAQELNTGEVSLKRMIDAVYFSNPDAFVNNDINNLKRGAILDIPTVAELQRFNVKTARIEQAVNVKAEAPNPSTAENKQTASKNTYTVKKGDTLSKIARTFAHKEFSLSKMMKLIHNYNPHAFSNNNINILKADAILNLPEFNETAPDKDRQIAQNSSAGPQSHTVAKPATSSERVTPPSNEFIPASYTVKKGDTLAEVVKEIGYKDVSFTKMMQAIYAANPHAFLKSNITILKEGAVIQLPPLSEVNITKLKNVKIKKETLDTNNMPISKQASSKTLVSSNSLKAIEENKGIINKLEKRIRELRRELVKNKHEVSYSGSTTKSGGSPDKSPKSGGYTVKKGDTLARVVKKIGHKNVSFTKMMKAVYTANPDAFSKRNITRLKEGSVIHVPSLSEINGTATPVSRPPTSQLPNLENKQRENKTLEIQLTALRKDLLDAKSRQAKLELKMAMADNQVKEQKNAPKPAIKQAVVNKPELIEKEETATNQSVQNTQKIESKPNTEVTTNDATNKSSETLVADKYGQKDSITSLDTFLSGLKSLKIPDDFDVESVETKEAVVNHIKSLSNKDLAYSAMALFLGLLLLRYRKQLYNYVNIPSDQPKYYAERRRRPRLTPQEQEKLKQELENPQDLNDVSDNETNGDVNEEFLHECEHLAEDINKNPASAETAFDDFTTSKIEKIKADMEREIAKLSDANEESEGSGEDISELIRGAINPPPLPTQHYSTDVEEEIDLFEKSNRASNDEDKNDKRTTKDTYSDFATKEIELDIKDKTSVDSELRIDKYADKSESETYTTADFEEISLDLFEDHKEEPEEVSSPVGDSEAISASNADENAEGNTDDITEVGKNKTDPATKTDWEKLLEEADKQLAETFNQTEEIKAVEPQPVIETEGKRESESEPTSEDVSPANFHSGSFVPIEIVDLDTVKTSFTPQNKIRDKFEEAAIDELFLYDEYCRNQTVTDDSEQLSRV